MNPITRNTTSHIPEMLNNMNSVLKSLKYVIKCAITLNATIMKDINEIFS